MFAADVHDVFVSSPGDVAAERELVSRVVAAWNSQRARSTRVVLRPVRWELDASPGFHEAGPQGPIDEQLLERADLVVALFRTRLGTSDDRQRSGTVREIERARALGIPVQVFFGTAAPHAIDDVDLEQLAALRTYRGEVRALALVMEFSGPEDLERQVRRGLEHYVEAATSTEPLAGTARRGAHIEVSCLPRPGPALSSGVAAAHDVVVRNAGDLVAEGLTVEIVGADKGRGPYHRAEGAADLGIGETRRIATLSSDATATVWDVVVDWVENGSATRVVHRVETTTGGAAEPGSSRTEHEGGPE